MRRRHLTILVCTAALAAAAPASAQTIAGGRAADQTQTQKPRPPAPARPGQPRRDPVGFRAYVNFDYLSIAAKDSFEAVLGTSTISAVGGGGEVLNLWK